MIGRKQSIGGGVCWGWELLNYVTDSVIKTETSPSKPLYMSCSVTWTDVYLTYYWLLLLWLSLFTNCTVTVKGFTLAFFNHRHVSLLAIRSSHLKGSFQEAAEQSFSSSNMCVLLSWPLLPYLRCRTRCHFDFACYSSGS